MKSLYGFGILCVFFFTVSCQIFPFESLLNKCPAEQREQWSYRGLNGPPFWRYRFQTCAGRLQSPIPLISANAIPNESLEQLHFINYDQPIFRGRIENNGHTIEVTPEDGINRTISVNRGVYRLQQLHFHWGDTCNKGSEHTLDGKRYAMEMHLVHMNANGQVAVVGIFFQEQDNDNKELQKIIKQFPGVKYKDGETELESRLNLNNLLPGNPTSYIRYQGSLTTPPCTEGVTWSVIPHPIPIGSAQMRQFREQLYSVRQEDALDSCKLINNYRPLQRPRWREVYLSQ